jgi:hypothetical protein
MTTLTYQRGAGPDAAEWLQRRVYEAECALHDAHTSGIDGWVMAAAERLHRALSDLERAQPRRRPLSIDRAARRP